MKASGCDVLVGLMSLSQWPSFALSCSKVSTVIQEAVAVPGVIIGLVGVGGLLVRLKLTDEPGQCPESTRWAWVILTGLFLLLLGGLIQ